MYRHASTSGTRMGIIGGRIGYAVLRSIAPTGGHASSAEDAEQPVTGLEDVFGKDFLGLIRNKVVIDYGCGTGNQSIEMAQRGAAKVIGLEIQEHLLQHARERADQLGLGERCLFAKYTEEPADIIVSKDAFEHYADPALVLELMSALLKTDGQVFAAFGPTWLHPYGGHLFSIFPWSHLIFTEKCQIRWRADFKNDGATRFCDVAGGLNQLTISRFERVVAASPFRIEWMQTVPIRGIGLFKFKLLREIGTSIVRCKLRLKVNGKVRH